MSEREAVMQKEFGVCGRENAKQVRGGLERITSSVPVRHDSRLSGCSVSLSRVF